MRTKALPPNRLLLLLLLAINGCSEPISPRAALDDGVRFSAGIGEHGVGGPGSIVFTHRPPANTPVNIWVMNPDGSDPRQLTFSLAGTANITPDWSPDGKLIAFTSTRDGDADVYVMRADGSDLVQLTDAPGVDQGPVWSPDGKQIAFYSEREGDFEIYVMDADGSNQRPLTDHAGIDQYPDWSPNGKLIAFQRDNDIYMLDVTDGSTRLVWDAPNRADMPEFSPNGKQLVFMARYPAPALGCHVFLLDLEGGDPVDLTPRPPGVPLPFCNYFPSFSKNGQRIYFGAGRPDQAGADDEIFVINLDGSGLTRLTFQVGQNSAPVQR